MKSFLKTFIFGFLVGGVLAAWPAYNIGRGAPAFDNPFSTKQIQAVVKEQVDQTVEGTREKIHDLTKPPAK
jgi:hypothetical protein